MYTNQSGCTVYERTVGKERMEAYIRHTFPNDVYWQESTGETADGKSRKQSDAVLCIVPAASIGDYIPKRDDLICCGISEADEPPEGCFTVTQVKNFLYGSKGVQHLEVTAV